MRHNVAGVQPEIVDGSVIPVSLTGTTLETELARFKVGREVGAGSMIRLSYTWSLTNNANAKQMRVRLNSLAGQVFGGVNMLNYGGYNQVGQWWVTETGFKGFQAPQVGGGSAGILSIPADLSAPQDLVITGHLASAADTMTLEAWMISIYRL